VSPTAGKVRALPAATVWRRSVAGPVVFTNGVFDLLHPGHVELLEAARREGAALVVGVNSDASVRRLGKGEARPVTAEAARARVLAGLAAVDCVVLFDEDTPLALIQALQPDVLVKGADYSREDIVGADWVEARGGRVVRVPLLAGYSTSALVERLRAPS
jgi:rfaE bifunctional protein nucleotidyltransferase chain/domain